MFSQKYNFPKPNPKLFEINFFIFLIRYDTKTKNHDVKLEVLDILNVAISQYGSLFNNSSIYLPLKDAVLRELESSRKNNRKKATQCLGMYFS